MLVKRKVMLSYLVILGLLLAHTLAAIPVWADSAKTNGIAGEDRYKTAVAVSQKGWTSADYAVLARGDNFADALCAGPLAYKYNGPILLTEAQSLNEDALKELQRLGVKHLFIAGGPEAVSRNVEDTLKANGINTIERLYGNSRYETSIRIAEKIGAAGKAVLATGADFPDALSVSAIAAQKGMPILLTEKDRLPDVVSNYLISGAITKTYLIGGTDVISNSVEESLSGSVRLAGGNRYETNTAVLRQFAAELSFEEIYVASGGGSAGGQFADALTGAVLAAQTFSPLILTGQALPAGTDAYLQTKLLLSSKVKRIGGEEAVAVSVLQHIIALKEQIPVEKKYSAAGSYGPETGSETIKGSVIISADGVTLKNTVIEGDLLIGQSVGDGSVYLDHVTVQGKITVNGCGPNSFWLNYVSANGMGVTNLFGNLAAHATGSTTISNVTMETGGRLVGSNLTGGGFENVEISSGARVSLDGRFRQVNIQDPGTQVSLGSGTVTTVNIAGNAGGSEIDIGSGASLGTLNVNAPSNITGGGQIGAANVFVNNVNIAPTPDSFTILSGVTASIGGTILTGNGTTTSMAGSSGGSGDSGGSSSIALTGISAITGTAKVGSELTAGSVSPAGAAAAYQWMICDTADGSYANIAGATSGSYTPLPGDAEMFIKVAATGTGGYTGTVTSAATGPMAVISAVTSEAFSTSPLNNTVIITLSDGKFKAAPIVAGDFTFAGMNAAALAAGTFTRISDTVVTITGLGLFTAADNTVLVKAATQASQAASVTAEASTVISDRTSPVFPTTPLNSSMTITLTGGTFKADPLTASDFVFAGTNAAALAAGTFTRTSDTVVTVTGLTLAGAADNTVQVKGATQATQAAVVTGAVVIVDVTTAPFTTVDGNNTVTIILTGGTFKAEPITADDFTFTGTDESGLSGATTFTRTSDTVVTITGLGGLTGGTDNEILVKAEAQATQAASVAAVASTS